MAAVVRTEPILAKAIQAREDGLHITLMDQRRVHMSWDQCSPRLASADSHQRLHAELSPGGYGIHWPLLDEDLSIQGLVSSGLGTFE